MWNCTDCDISVGRTYELLKHLRLIHGHYGRKYRYPCTYTDCPCTFTSWKSLMSHTYKAHAKKATPKSSDLSNFQYQLCKCKELSTEREYFLHIRAHLKRHETVPCAFVGCTFQTNVYGTYNSHRNRKHSSYTLKDFNTKVITFTDNLPGPSESCATDEVAVFTEEFENVGYETLSDTANYREIVEDLPKLIEQRVASILLRLGNISHVPSVTFNEVLDEINYLLSSASVPVTKGIITGVFSKHNLQIDDVIISKLAAVVCELNPLGKGIGKKGPLATAFKRKQYYKEHFRVVEPVECILDAKKKMTFQYVPLVQSLQQILSNTCILENIVKGQKTCREQEEYLTNHQQQYKSYRDGQYFKENSFLCSDELRISITLCLCHAKNINCVVSTGF